MPLQLTPGDAAALAALPELARRAITADLKAAGERPAPARA